MPEILQIPCEIVKVESILTNQVRLRIDTQEISPDDAARIMRLRGEYGWMVFRKGEKIGDGDITGLPPLPTREEETKSPAMRMRGVMFRLWEQAGKPDDFEVFYRVRMDRMIDALKEKLT